MKRFYDNLCKAEAAIAATFLLLMVALVFLGGTARMARYPLNWTIDFATCLFAWAAFFAADVAWRNNNLMSIELVTSRLPEQTRRLVAFLNYLIIIVFLAYLIGAGLWLSWISRARSFQGIPAISYSWVTMSLPVGASLLLITTLLKVREEIRSHPARGPVPR